MGSGSHDIDNAFYCLLKPIKPCEKLFNLLLHVHMKHSETQHCIV